MGKKTNLKSYPNMAMPAAYPNPNLCAFVPAGYRHHETGKLLNICSRIGCTNYGYGYAPQLRAQCKTPKVLLGESVAVLIQVLGLGLIRPTSGCKCLQRKEDLNKYSWSPPDWIVRLLGMQARTVQELVELGEVVPLDT